MKSGKLSHLNLSINLFPSFIPARSISKYNFELKKKFFRLKNIRDFKKMISLIFGDKNNCKLVNDVLHMLVFFPKTQLASDVLANIFLLFHPTIPKSQNAINKSTFKSHNKV